MQSTGSSFCFFPSTYQIGYRLENHVFIFESTKLFATRHVELPEQVRFFSPLFDHNKMLVVFERAPASVVVWNTEFRREESRIEVGEEILRFTQSHHFAALAGASTLYVIKIAPLMHMAKVSCEGAPPFDIAQTDNNHCILCYADPVLLGNIHLAKIPTASAPLLFRAHKSQIQTLAISPDCNMILTASKRGTIIRLWNVLGKLLCESRRGYFNASVVHLTFSPCSRYFCAASNHNTAHIFSIEKQELEDNSLVLPKSNWRISLKNGQLHSAYFLETYNTVCCFADDGTAYIHTLLENPNTSIISSQMAPQRIAMMMLNNR